MIALFFKRRLKFFRQKRLIRIRHIQKPFQLRAELIGGVRLRYAAIEYIAEIYLIQAQNIVEHIRNFKRAVFTIFKNRDIRGQNILEFLMIAHICNGALYIPIQKKLTDLHIRSPFYKIKMIKRYK